MAFPGLDGIGTRLPKLEASGRYLVALSGGLDSTVLLHSLVKAGVSAPLEAVHVHHGLQAVADRWPDLCQQLCTRLGVAFTLLHVTPECGPRQSLEAEARRARYQALREVMHPGDILLTAHHLDDQAETLMLQLLRGAGPRGLAAMPELSEFIPGWHARPLLACPRTVLQDYAQRHALEWIEDPSNTDTTHSRNFLRQAIMPKLRERWPEVATVLARSAKLSAQAANLLDQLAEEDLHWCAGPQTGSLLIPALRQLAPGRRRNLLRAWIGWLGLSLPEEQHLLRVDTELLEAADDATPVLAWPGTELRRYRECLFAMPCLPEPDAGWQSSWDRFEPLPLPAGCGLLVAEPATTPPSLRLPREKEVIQVRLAQAGEKLRLPGRDHHTALKNLCQEAGIAPWLRRRLPVLLYGQEIAAVADRWVCAGFVATVGEPAWRVRWQDPPCAYPDIKTT